MATQTKPKSKSATDSKPRAQPDQATLKEVKAPVARKPKKSSGTASKPKTLSLKITLSPDQKAMLTRAAKALKTSVSEYVVQKACAEAESLLLKPIRYQLNEEQWDEFMKRLDEPPRKLPRLKKLMTEPGVHRTVEAKP